MNIKKTVLEEIKSFDNGSYFTYIKNNILPKYLGDKAHGLEHIYSVTNRAFDLNDYFKLNLNPKMISAIVFFHDIGRMIDDETHEIISAEIFMKDKTMKSFFNEEERLIIKEAIEDHRSSHESEARSIYGKLISSADKNIDTEQPLIRTYEYRVKKNPNSSLEDKIRESYKHLKEKFGEEGYAVDIYYDDGAYKNYLDDLRQLLDNYDSFRSRFLKTNGINELDYYLKNVNKELINYVESNIFPKYKPNDSGHNLLHIKEVIRRSFELNENLNLGLSENLIYTIAACHDLGKYIDHETHEKIAAKLFIEDNNFKQFFKDEERTIIKEAIEDHRSSFEDFPRSKYGELVSSADRNTSVTTTFSRSFAVGITRTPDMIYSDYLEYTFKRLNKRYGDENPENMFLIDEKYNYYLKEIRELLSDAEKFNKRYSEVNNIKTDDYTKPLSKLTNNISL